MSPLVTGAVTEAGEAGGSACRAGGSAHVPRNPGQVCTELAPWSTSVFYRVSVTSAPPFTAEKGWLLLTSAHSGLFLSGGGRASASDMPACLVPSNTSGATSPVGKTMRASGQEEAPKTAHGAHGQDHGAGTHSRREGGREAERQGVEGSASPSPRPAPAPVLAPGPGAW